MLNLLSDNESILSKLQILFKPILIVQQKCAPVAIVLVLNFYLSFLSIFRRIIECQLFDAFFTVKQWSAISWQLKEWHRFLIEKVIFLWLRLKQIRVIFSNEIPQTTIFLLCQNFFCLWGDRVPSCVVDGVSCFQGRNFLLDQKVQFLLVKGSVSEFPLVYILHLVGLFILDHL